MTAINDGAGFEALPEYRCGQKRRRSRSVVTGWTVVDMSTPRLPKVVPEIDANLMRSCGEGLDKSGTWPSAKYGGWGKFVVSVSNPKAERFPTSERGGGGCLLIFSLLLDPPDLVVRSCSSRVCTEHFLIWWRVVHNDYTLRAYKAISERLRLLRKLPKFLRDIFCRFLAEPHAAKQGFFSTPDEQKQLFPILCYARKNTKVYLCYTIIAA